MVGFQGKFQAERLPGLTGLFSGTRWNGGGTRPYQICLQLASIHDGGTDKPWFCLSPIAELNLVKNAALAEMGFLRFLPAAKDLVDSEQNDFGKSVGIFLSHGFQARAIIMPGGDFLTFGSV